MVTGSRIDLDVTAASVRGGDAFGDPADAVVHLGPRALAGRPDRALDLGDLGDHVVGGAGGDPSDGDHGGSNTSIDG